MHEPPGQPRVQRNAVREEGTALAWEGRPDAGEEAAIPEGARNLPELASNGQLRENEPVGQQHRREDAAGGERVRTKQPVDHVAGGDPVDGLRQPPGRARDADGLETDLPAR